MRFVKGVIDSSDLPLNISREMLQQSSLLTKIRQGTVSRILKELKKRTKDYEDYLKFWKAFGIAFKEGIYEDFSNREEVASLALFSSTFSNDKLTSLDEYISRAKPDQKTIYYVTGDDVPTLSNNPQLEIFKENGIEVLLLTDPIDEFWTQTLTTYKTFSIKHISKADIDLNIARKDKRALDGDLEKLVGLMSKMFVNEVGKVVVTEKLTKSPAALNVEDGQMSIHLERLMRYHQQQTTFASTRILEINPYHPLIIKLSEMIIDEKNKAELEDVARLVLDQAKIAEGEAVSDPAFFALKFSEYILKAM
jgi:molecular chaperone HtpG